MYPFSDVSIDNYASSFFFNFATVRDIEITVLLEVFVFICTLCSKLEAVL